MSIGTHLRRKGTNMKENLGHATIAFFTAPVFGESISTIILGSREVFWIRKWCQVTISLLILMKTQNDSENGIQLHIHNDIVSPFSDKPLTPVRISGR